MVRAEASCGHGCGGGHTYYLTWTESGWARTALRMEWMGSDEFRD